MVTSGSQLADGSRRIRWVFQIAVAQRDRHLLEAIQMFLGAGAIYDRAPQKSHWQPTSILTIASRKAHRERVIPFGNRFLLATAKRRQFELWRDALYHYESLHPRRQRSVCSVDDCTGLVRGRGLCRSHYYRATGY
ncbi:MAG: endonuclease [Actinomycetota bacterium]|nr:endonuclease [Actinomycetota bacterium]